jgi:hypothetical protein
MTSTGNDSGIRYAEDVIDEAVDTLDRLRDLQPGAVPPIHIPDGMERWKADAAKAAREREQAEQERQQQDAEIAGTMELAAAEAEAESDASWEEWLSTRLAAERATVLGILAEVVGTAVAELRAECEASVNAFTRELELERAARRRDRDRAAERVQALEQDYAGKVAVLTAKVDAQQRALELSENRQVESEVEHERRLEREEAAAAMLRALFEEMMLRR